MNRFSVLLTAALLSTVNIGVLQPTASAQEVAVIALKQNSAMDFFMRGMERYQKGDTQGALADYNQALAINPRFGQVYAMRAVLKDEKLNDTKGAMADFDRSISLTPD
jgi:tetratricopeptide (TPR) repeat protein